jgi:hypothetical protein
MSNDTPVLEHYELTGRAHVAYLSYCGDCAPCDGHDCDEWVTVQEVVTPCNVFETMEGKQFIDRGGWDSPVNVLIQTIFDSGKFAGDLTCHVFETKDVKLTPVYALPIDAQLRLAGVPGLFEVQP